MSIADRNVSEEQARRSRQGLRQLITKSGAAAFAARCKTRELRDLQFWLDLGWRPETNSKESTWHVG